MVKIPRLSDAAAVKYQQIMQFTIRPHTIQIQARHDLDKQWLPMAYKVTDEDLDATIQDWLTKWQETVSAKEVSTRPPTDAPEDPVREALATNGI